MYLYIESSWTVLWVSGYTGDIRQIIRRGIRSHVHWNKGHQICMLCKKSLINKYLTINIALASITEDPIWLINQHINFSHQLFNKFSISPMKYIWGLFLKCVCSRVYLKKHFLLFSFRHELILVWSSLKKMIFWPLVSRYWPSKWP